ncbi:hypothetical protein Ahy_B03g068787 isoform B [Arachis hypogaea]|uniref:Uncharacterized protein n=1 Tax=Arachis hypogaea TaxID=3818 RepID=A0A445AAV6_ARAHY|nr:hypothetical protein Ahy_B03g068787 isoform B [Arachis hypogaea]
MKQNGKVKPTHNFCQTPAVHHPLLYKTNQTKLSTLTATTKLSTRNKQLQQFQHNNQQKENNKNNNARTADRGSVKGEALSLLRCRCWSPKVVYLLNLIKRRCPVLEESDVLVQNMKGKEGELGERSK